ncbi:hypothetical protein L1D59_22490, partial [Pseudoalteromonas piscicida]|uniref:hypothetical protein n=1 Tax=Pseudoalteromonas piscicida TaxID=43662 RepID=UPI001EFE66A6
MKSAKYGAAYLISTFLFSLLCSDVNFFQPVTWLLHIADSRSIEGEVITTSNVYSAWLLVISVLTIGLSLFCVFLARLYAYVLDSMSLKYYGNKIY